ncbi:MAG TPA: hypothetical protein DEO54_06675 [Rikenellaceae bacterium]|jgi:hypothetical protein|nr:MAG: hypothetical protein A2X20_08380 [Bacteroidetes bacterium GWE2_40_15]PKP06301.1 MAG: hypothetical protein CVU10_01685 [Bacteroidetes bacterium HGW-Bacteroidetes-5]HBZ25910.1 hypothetical protein [Rikenellaceae bacterium]
MRHISFILFFSLFAALSCSREYIPQKRMPEIIAQLYKVDRYINTDYKLVLRADTIKIYESIFNHYGYTSEDFINTLDYYLSRPLKLKSFYAQAKILLEKEEEAIIEIIRNRERADSIAAPIRKMVELSNSVIKYDPKNRAIRWIVLPEKHPEFRVSLGDSLTRIYETPTMSRWWRENYQSDTTKFSIIKINEKNRRTIPLPTELIIADPEGGSYLR